jgi:uncharacterized protein
LREETEAVSVLQGGMSRRAFLKNGIRWGAGLAGAAAFGTGYTIGLEPRMLEVVRIRLELPNMPAAFRGVTVAHFSDVHFGFHFNLKRLRTLVDRIGEEKADMIVFTGDLVEEAVGNAGLEMAEILGRLKAPLGKFAVLGNHDYYHNEQEVADVLELGGFRCLRNESLLVEKDGESIRVTGVEDYTKGRPNMENALKASTPGEFCMLLAHTPDFAIKALQHPVHLQLSGHSHGGQIRMPFRGPIIKVPGARLFSDGLVQIPGGKLQLYTNRGIGVTGLPVRFLCRPELTLHTFG